MKILVLADEECAALWDYYRPGKLAHYDLILSCGDLKGEYLRFLVTMARCPLLYVHGNHDGRYELDPPEGCDSIEDKLVVYKGLRILGLGGCRKYSGGKHQYTERQMEKRIRKLKRAILLAGGVDIVLTHAAPQGYGDAEDRAHRGFEAFLGFIDTYHPQYIFHGHVHSNYSHDFERTAAYGETRIVNCCGKIDIDLEPRAQAVKISRLQQRFVRNLEIIA